MQFAQQRHMPTIVFPARFDLPAVITPRMFRPYRGNIPGGRLMPAAAGKSEREKEVNFSHLARKRSHFSCCENGSKTWRVTPGSTRVSLFIAALRRNVLSLSLFHSLFGE